MTAQKAELLSDVEADSACHVTIFRVKVRIGVIGVFGFRSVGFKIVVEETADIIWRNPLDLVPGEV